MSIVGSGVVVERGFWRVCWGWVSLYISFNAFSILVGECSRAGYVEL